MNTEPRVAHPPAPRLADQLHPHAAVLGRGQQPPSGAGMAASAASCGHGPGCSISSQARDASGAEALDTMFPLVALRAVLAR